MLLGVVIDPSSTDMQGMPPAVDASQPTTLLQVKLADGKKMKAKYDFFISYISTFNEVVISVLLL
jgi:hypothetical protein